MTIFESLAVAPRYKTDAELIQLLSGKPVDVSIRDLKRMTAEEMQTLGLTPRQAEKLAAGLELGRRAATIDATQDRRQVTSSDDAYQYLKYLNDYNEETFVVVFMDRRSKVIRTEELFKGGLAAIVVDPKVIFRRTLELKAAAIILAHNHPSGSPQPSMEDIRLTEKVRQAGQLLDVQVLDHVIVGDNRYYSFADEGKM
jgi:DNA repair protein RadC